MNLVDYLYLRGILGKANGGGIIGGGNPGPVGGIPSLAPSCILSTGGPIPCMVTSGATLCGGADPIGINPGGGMPACGPPSTPTPYRPLKEKTYLIKLCSQKIMKKHFYLFRTLTNLNA